MESLVKSRWPVLIALSVCLMSLGLSPSASADTVGEAVDIVEYMHEYQLADSRIEIRQGIRQSDGKCSFDMPILEFGPLDSAVEARPLSVDLRRCAQTIEIGIPPVQPAEDDSGVQLTEEFFERPDDFERMERPPGYSSFVASPAAAGSATVYYEVRWEDIVNLTTTRTRAYLDWSWNDICVTSSSAWGTYWYLAITGWSIVSNGGFKTSSCDNHRSVVDWAHYMNNSFCWPTDVDTHVNDAWARGYHDGRVNGGVLGTWTVEDPSDPTCPNLHYHTVLVKQ